MKYMYVVMKDKDGAWDASSFDYDKAVGMANMLILEGKPVYCIAKVGAETEEDLKVGKGCCETEYFPGKDFKVRIQDARHFANLTQQQVFENWGIPVRTIEAWEAGDRTPPEYVERLLIKAMVRSRQA